MVWDFQLGPQYFWRRRESGGGSGSFRAGFFRSGSGCFRARSGAGSGPGR